MSPALATAVALDLAAFSRSDAGGRVREKLAAFLERVEAFVGERDGGKAVLRLHEQADAQQLAAERDPIGARLVATDAVGAERLVFPATDFLGVAAAEHFGDVLQPGGESAVLADAEHAAEKLPAIDGGVVFLARREAVVAAAAVVVRPVLAEVAEQM